MPPSPNAAQTQPDIPLFIGHTYADDAPAPRTIHTIYATRKRDVYYQALIHYQPISVPLAEIPGLAGVLETASKNGVTLPERVNRVDDESEMLMDNLGEPLRLLISYRAYCDPQDARVIAYDMVQSAGGQPQRMIGRVTRTGVSIDIFRGTEFADHHDIPFVVRDTFIPITFDFIHQWYQLPENKAAKEEKKPIRFSIFAPQAMVLVLLAVRPLDDCTIPVGDANYDCARYEIIATSAKSETGLQARQEMYFDKRSGLLVRRQDFENGMDPADAPVTERETSGQLASLARLRPLPEPAPQLAPKPFPYALGEDLLYTVKSRDEELGQVRVRYDKATGTAPHPQPLSPEGRGETSAAFVAKATVDLEAAGAVRHETATTYFDKDWYATSYDAQGTESADGRNAYQLSAKIEAGKVTVAMHRQIAETPAAPAAPANAVPKPETRNPKPDPLQRVPISDEDAKALETPPPPRHVDYSIDRVFPAGIFLMDFNRIEQLAALAARFPLETKTAAYQKAALFLVRQDRCGVLQFEIKPEPRPVLSERQQRRLGLRGQEEPQLYLASAANAMLPCELLLAPDGRLLQVTLKYGAGNVIYALDDPLMRQRAERAKQQRMQEGPLLIRPPWY